MHRKWGLPQEALKLIACVTMLIDHFAVAIVPELALPGAVEIYYACRMIGRIAFPIYCFLLVEGMRRTRSAGKYILRLLVCIFLAELPFDYLFEGGFTWSNQNVMVTLTLGACMLLCMEKTEKKWLKLVVVLPFAVAAELFKCDYGGGGIVILAVFALFEPLLLQTVALFLVNWQLSTTGIQIFGIVLPIQLMALVAMLPIGLYNGKKLTRSKAVQWGFYLFYPVHLLVLWVISGIIG